MELIFRTKTDNIVLNSLNDKLYKNSKGRFELRQTTDGSKYYMIDFDEQGQNRVIKNYKELIDILDCMHIVVLELNKNIIRWKLKEC